MNETKNGNTYKTSDSIGPFNGGTVGTKIERRHIKEVL